MVQINIFDNQSKLNLSKDSISLIVRECLTEERQACEEVSIHFVSTEEISRLHLDFFNDPTTTDCISFPMDDENEEYRILGEVFVCPETAINYAESHAVDKYEETTLYIIHGLLHLMGYDDIEESDRKEMRSAEQRHLSRLKSKNLCLSSNSTKEVSCNY